MSSKFKYFKIRLASPEEILSWSHGEVKNHETINYRTQKPEPDGLFCEKIFGPIKDYKCACGKSHNADKGTVCDKCGVEITKKDVRRERMGHIKLASPVVHTWFLKNSPSRIATLLDIKAKDLEEVVYLASYIVIDPGKTNLSKRQILSEAEYSRYKEDYGRGFIALTGAEAVKKLLQDIDLVKEDNILRKELHSSTKQKREKIIKRLEVVEAFINSENKPEWMVLDVLPVIPPDLRPMVQLTGGRFATTDLNDLYRRIINRNNRLKRQYEQNAPHLITKNEKRMLQEAVDALIDNSKRGKKAAVEKARPLKSLSDLLRGKQGRFRQNLLGKRVDYSGRSVIIIGPNLQMHQCGIPKEMALTLFQPFVSRELIKQGYGSAQAKRLIDQKNDNVWEVLEGVIKEHPILLNRAPSLHRLSIQAFEPVLVEGKAIRLHPLVCTAFNADFDGDQMAVHLPLSHEAQAEARLLMLASNNILNPKDGKPVVTPSQDMVLGNYYLTLEYRYEPNHQDPELRHISEKNEGKFFVDFDEVFLAYKNDDITLHTRIFLDPKSLSPLKFKDVDTRNRYLYTTLGKMIFNSILPEEFPYINEPTETNLVDRCPQKYFFSIKDGDNRDEFLKRPSVSPFKKKYLGAIIAQVFKKYQVTETSKMLDRLKNLGFYYSTVSGITISATDIEIYSHKNERLQKAEEVITKVDDMYDLGACTEEERKKRTAKEWADARNEMEAGLWKELEVHPTNHIYMMADSGSRGSRSNFSQLAGMRGLMNDTAGNVIEVPVKANFREGLSVSEFFISTHGARKGSTDTALKTAQSGYLTRRLVDVAQDVVITETDCGTDRGVVLKAIVGEDGKEAMSLRERILGRYTASPIIDPATGAVIVEKNQIINEDLADQVAASGVVEANIRTNLTCQAKHGVCKHCYGRNLATNKEVEVGEAVGVIAAQSIGEPGTQLTMRTFHDGGVASAGDITQGLPRVQELIEIRNPKGRAILCEVEGEVTSITKTKLGNVISIQTAELDKNGSPIVVKYTADATSELKIDTKDNRFVHRGDRLMAGAIFPRDLLRIEDALSAQNYIVEEVQKVYRSQGVEISDKHIEIICRQMMKKVKVITEGDTRLLPGKTVTRNEFDKAVKYALDTNGELPTAQPVLLGITKAALGSPSFLSAASFQETTKVLTDAAIKSKVDKLYGLKENVIVGGLIPAGTGILEEDEFKYEGRPVDLDEDDFDFASIDSPIKEIKETIISKEMNSTNDDIVDSSTDTLSDSDIIGNIDDDAYSFDDDIEEDIIG